MRKHAIIVLAATACAAPAFAQVGSTGGDAVTSSTVTLFGVVDVAYAWGDGGISNVQRLVSSGHTSSRLGIRVFEDLGGGLAAGAWLEAGVNADNGTGSGSNTNNQADGAGPTGNAGTQGLTFNRRSTVSLMSASWGELRLGRDYVATFRNRDQADPFGTNGVGANQADVGSIAGVTSVRASNMLGYFLPAGRLGGLFGEIQYYLGENASNTANSHDGNGWQARLGYSNGPWGIAVAGGRTTYQQTATTGDVDVFNVAGHYEFGFGRVSAGYFREKVKQDPATLKADGYIVGLSAPFGPAEFRASFSSYGTNAAGDPTTRKLALGGVYNLSKRTALYATYAHLDNRGTADASLNGSSTGPGQGSNGVDIGLKHSF